MTPPTETIVVPKNWYTLVVLSGVDCDKPGIYEWDIESVGCYIGKYKRNKRPMREYTLNVTRLLNGKPYRKNKPDQFRRIHRELACAFVTGRRVTLSILENVPKDEINRREQELIASRGTLNGPVVIAVSGG